MITQGELEWISLEKQDPLVVGYEKAKRDTYSGIPVVDVQSWVKSLKSNCNKNMQSKTTLNFDLQILLSHFK